MDPKFTKLLDSFGLDDFNSHIVSTIKDPVLFSQTYTYEDIIGIFLKRKVIRSIIIQTICLF